MKNKNKNQIKKRIGALLCALVVAVSAFGASTPYYANIGGIPSFDDKSCFSSSVMGNSAITSINTYNSYALVSAFDEILLFVGNSISVSDSKLYIGGYGSYENSAMLFYIKDGKWSSFSNGYGGYICDKLGAYFQWKGLIAESSLSDFDVLYFSQSVYDENGSLIYNAGYQVSSEKYNPAFGYLQNIQRKSTYIRGALYNYDEDSLTQHWYHGLITTSGVDLTSGAYKIRHYISNATVTGYEKDDIVEMSDKYQVGEYDASKGYFSYLQKDYDDKLVEQGYKELGFVDTVFNGYFTLQHHYFQIVDTSTNEVGGYLHFYPKDAKGDNFWTDYVDLGYEGMDNDFVVDEEGPSGTIENIVGSGETVEDALENADSPKLGDLSGVDEVASNLEAYASQISNVTSGIGALLAEFPAWIVGLLGLSVALIFVVIVVKSLRG